MNNAERNRARVMLYNKQFVCNNSAEYTRIDEIYRRIYRGEGEGRGSGEGRAEIEILSDN